MAAISILLLLAVAIAPPILVWRLLGSTHVGSGLGRRLTGRGIVAVLGPPLVGWLCLFFLWLASFDGRCFGWFGESSSCAFRQYADEIFFWATLIIAVPGVIGVASGVAVALFHRLRG